MSEQEHIKARNLYARMIMSQADYTCTPVVEYESAEAKEPEIYYEHKWSFVDNPENDENLTVCSTCGFMYPGGPCPACLSKRMHGERKVVMLPFDVPENLKITVINHKAPALVFSPTFETSPRRESRRKHNRKVKRG